MFEGELAVGLFDLVFGCIFCNIERYIGVVEIWKLNFGQLIRIVVFRDVRGIALCLGGHLYHMLRQLIEGEDR